MTRQIHASGITFEFKAAIATNTRLMGVVGMQLHWKSQSGDELIQIVHLDFEEYGIDGFHAFLNESQEEVDRTLRGVTGGLGGVFVSINFEEAMALLIEAREIEPFATAILVEFEALELLMDAYSALDLTKVMSNAVKTLSPVLNTPEECLNYFVMRLVGHDDLGARTLMLEDGKLPENVIDTPSTLLRNACICLNEVNGVKTYEVSALIDFENKYQVLIFEMDVMEASLKIMRAELKERLTVSSIEASFNLNKPEYMLVIHVKDAFFERKFERLNPELMKQSYINGQMYIEYNDHNGHVAENPYYLNGDLYATYYFVNSGQLVISSFNQAHIAEIDRLFQENGVYDESLSMVCELKTDYAMLYSFAQSAYENIFDYLDQQMY